MATLAGRPTSSYRLRAQAPAGPRRWSHEEQWHERPGVAQFIYLSMLLHAIAILLFGAPPGGSSEGRAMWGSLSVQLVAPAPDIVVPPRMEPLMPVPLPRLERELRIPPAPPRRVEPAPQSKTPAPPPAITVPIIVPPAMERIIAPALRLDRALPTPRIEAVPIPVAPPVAIPAPIAPIVPDLPRVERTMADTPKIEAPLAQPIAPALPVRERPVAPPEIPRVETPVVPTLPAAPALPAIERAPDIAPKAATPPPPPVPEVAPRTEPKAEPRPAPPPVTREELPTPRVLPARPAPPVPAPPQPRAGDYDPTKPTIDLDEMRRRASEISRQGVGQRALLPFPMPAPPERKTKTEEALDKARKPDCRTAYQNFGLLAAVPLIANEFGEGSCRW